MFDSFAAIGDGMSDSLGRVGMCSGLVEVSLGFIQTEYIFVARQHVPSDPRFHQLW